MPFFDTCCGLEVLAKFFSSNLLHWFYNNGVNLPTFKDLKQTALSNLICLGTWTESHVHPNVLICQFLVFLSFDSSGSKITFCSCDIHLSLNINGKGRIINQGSTLTVVCWPLACRNNPDNLAEVWKNWPSWPVENHENVT